MNATDVKEFQMRNLHSTGQSYISALEDETKYLINGVEETMKLLKNQLKSFKNERTGTFHRWEYFSIHFSRTSYDCLMEDDINWFENRFKGDNKMEITEICNKHFEIYITRKPDLVSFEVVVKTYAYIGINEGAIQYLDEEQGKLMIARKLTLLKKNA